MPTVMEPSHADYDQFRMDYQEPDQGITLDEAVARAVKLRSADKSHVYRVMPANDDQTTFRIEIISQERVYANFLARMSAWITRRLSR